jgi:quaternary ammonium compound-resistance protein SugE
MAWLILVVAGLFEVSWTLTLKYSDGCKRLGPTAATAALSLISIVLLGLAVRTLPIGTAYAVWTGIGAVGAVLLGILLFGEPATALRLLCIALIITGVLGLKLVAPPH